MYKHNFLVQEVAFDLKKHAKWVLRQGCLQIVHFEYNPLFKLTNSNQKGSLMILGCHSFSYAAPTQFTT